MPKEKYYMKKRIKDKIKEIEKYLIELDEIKPKNLKDYIKDIKTKAASERYFEKIIEAIVDLAFLVIKENGLENPEEDIQAFNILEKEGIITPIINKKLKDAKGMRNIIAHQYGSLDDELIFIAITQEIDNDISEFIDMVKAKLK